MHKKIFLNLKNIFNIMFVIVGTLVGAGFASGKEIYSFFFVFEWAGLFGIIISSLIISLVIYKIFKVCAKHQILSYQGLCEFALKDRFRKNDYLNNIVNIFLIITFVLMISGFSSFLNQEFEINRLLGSLIIIIVCYLVFLNNINGLMKLSNYVMPFLIFFICYISFVKCSNTSFFIKMFYNKDLIGEKNLFLPVKSSIYAILYAGYNCILLIPILIPLKNKIYEKSNILVISILSFISIIILSFAIFKLLLLGNNSIYKLEMPIVNIVTGFGSIYKIIYFCIISVSIFTSAISAGCGFLNNCSIKKYKRNMVILLFSSFWLSQISFSTLVGLLYPILGICGTFEVLIVIFL